MTLARTINPARPTLASGLAGLLGLFCGLCAVFAGGATLIDGYSEVTQARWPMISAVVDRAEVAFVPTRKGSGGPLWYLQTRVHYEVGGAARTATVTSRTAFSEIDAACLQAAAQEQSKGSRIDIRYDPSRENRAVFASAELSSDRSRNDLILFSGFAVASAVLLALARYLRARAARVAPSPYAAQHARLALGILVVALGLALAGSTILALFRTDHVDSENLMAVPTGLIFVFAGVLVVLSPQYTAKELLATLLITCFAITFDWVAFGPGERQFTGSANGVGFVPSEVMGRAAFGVFAAILDIWAVAMWVGQFRRMFGAGPSGGPGFPTASPPPASTV